MLVRHGQAEHHVREITGGWTDTQLTPQGVEQAGLVGARLKIHLAGRRIHLASGNLLRVVQTAQIIGKSLEVDPVVYPQLTDLNNGIAAGKTHLEARRLMNQRTEPYVDWLPYPQAETFRQFFQRVCHFMDEFKRHHPDDVPILVTHAAAIHVIIDWWLKIPVEARTDFVAAPGSLTVLTINYWNEHTLVRLNDTAHLYGAVQAEVNAL